MYIDTLRMHTMLIIVLDIVKYTPSVSFVFSLSKIWCYLYFLLLCSSCSDCLLPSRDEGEKLAKLLSKCKVYYFENVGHNIIWVGDKKISLGLPLWDYFRITCHKLYEYFVA